MLSIIIPIYKIKDELLVFCLNSVINQTYKNIEIIVVLDGVDEKIKEICYSYSEKNKIIRIINQVNSGVSIARNNGIKAATGDWIWFVDADDWLELNACEMIIKHISQNKDSDIIFFEADKNKDKISTPYKYGFENFSNGFLTDNNRLTLIRKVVQSRNIAKNALTQDTIYHIWDKVFSRKFLIDNALLFPPNIPISEDKIFVFDCIKLAQNISFLNSILYHYRLNPSSVTNSYSKTIDKDRLFLLETLWARIGNYSKNDVSSNEDLTLIQDFYLFTIVMTYQILLKKYFCVEYNVSTKTRYLEAKEFMNTNIIKQSFDKVNVCNMKFHYAICYWLVKFGFYGLFVFLFRKLHR